MHRFCLIFKCMVVLSVFSCLTACSSGDTFSLDEAGIEDTVEEESIQNTEELESEFVSDVSAAIDEPASTEATVVYVFVCGQVVHPGVYELPYGSRICDAVEMAGGCLDSADINVVNQAELLVDGVKIYIPAEGEDISQSASTVGEDASQSGSTEDGRLNLNTATKEELMTLPGIGETKADAILEYRDSHGAFQQIEELMNIAGIKEGVFHKIEEYIMVK